mmetsp:Transcript_1070/g.2328  ORF Transcript_1070/g.2328 Transcript_1070/m.2328 type:complete len:81 (+) Transcript_1070:1901-2143(+)
MWQKDVMWFKKDGIYILVSAISCTDGNVSKKSCGLGLGEEKIDLLKLNVFCCQGKEEICQLWNGFPMGVANKILRKLSDM